MPIWASTQKNHLRICPSVAKRHLKKNIKSMWEVVLDALKDSAIAAPFLLIIYLFIEFLETNVTARNKTVKLLNGRFAPLVAGGVGLVPQCGFSVMATDLYCQKYLKLGTLVAFFVATSDEALPILLTNQKTVGVVWIVLVVKVLYAVALGYLINLFDKRPLATEYALTETGCCHHEIHQNNDQQSDDHNHEHNHQQTRWQKVWSFAKHPLLHTLKIFCYVFVVNTVFGLLLHYVGEPITQFASKLGFFQCFLTALVGLIPNCASSVVITGMYTEGIVSFSAMLAGLVSNSGIALAILFKDKNWKNFGIVGIMYAAGVLLGVVCYFTLPFAEVGLN